MAKNKISDTAYSSITAVSLAQATKVDGKILDSELDASYLLLNSLNLTSADNLNSYNKYSEAFDNKHFNWSEEMFRNVAQNMSASQRYELIRNCWYVIQADGEIHEKEIEFMDLLCQHLEISKEDNLLAQKSSQSAD